MGADGGPATGARRVAGLLLAAGAGRRMGRPKALVELEGEALVARAARALAGSTSGPLVVVLGAAAEQARARLPALPGTRLEVVVVSDGESGMGASLRAGLAAAGAAPDVGAALVALVDTPGIGAAALRRVACAMTGPAALARGAYGGRPGHPVLLGRGHWDGVVAGARGDEGARSYLRGRRDVELVELSDVATPDDIDTPDDLAAFVRARRGTAAVEVPPGA